MQNDPFNLVSATAVFKKHGRFISFFTLGAVLVTTIILFPMPQYFRSTATVISANPVLADKARLFNTNIQSLYSYFGSGDDLDRIYGIADMDTTYKKLVDEFSLTDYYKLDGDSLPLLRRKAVLRLREDLTVRKTEKGQLQVIAWTKEKQLSADLVNRMVAILQQREADIWENNYQHALAQILSSTATMETEYKQLSDSLSTGNTASHELVAANRQSLLEQIRQYRKTADEYRLAIQTNPPVLYVMESAVPAAKAERPDKIAIILAAFIISLVFSSLLVLINNRNPE